ncbi:MAG TPA: hypothetical protein VNH46_02915 [Gemmatimonadales bacterium]|nr:hypothetical protein [Gemmatimonadales bacterium]
MPDYPALPCYPCPHGSACCAYGVTLSEGEAAALGERYGREKIYRTRWGEWRTRIRAGRCAFLVANACTIHADPDFPGVCRGFPWIDAETGGPYEFDQTICPEFVRRPELVQIGKAPRPRALS